MKTQKIDKTYKKLVKLGVAKISKKTNIGDYSVSLFLDKNFEELSPTQVYGYISVFEKKYEIDLSEYKNEYLEYIKADQNSKPKLNVIKKTKWFKILSIIFGILAIGFGIGYYLLKEGYFNG